MCELGSGGWGGTRWGWEEELRPSYWTPVKQQDKEKGGSQGARRNVLGFWSHKITRSHSRFSHPLTTL